MATSRADKFITLCQRYERDALTLRAQHAFASEREERQVIGRYQTLEGVALDLAPITSEMKAARVQVIIESVLERLAEHKVTWLLNSIRKRTSYGINELGEWTAEGAIAQIDDMVPELCTRLSPQWNLTSIRHGRYFQVYHSTDLAAMHDLTLGEQRWKGSEREQWFREVAILKVSHLEHQLEEVFQLTNHIEGNWTRHREVVWVQVTGPLRSTSVGDIVVSLLSGTAWTVRNMGFQVIEQASEKEGGKTS